MQVSIGNLADLGLRKQPGDGVGYWLGASTFWILKFSDSLLIPIYFLPLQRFI